MSGSELRIVLTTVGDRARADAIALALVEERLAACVNVLPDVTSVYRWKGAVERAGECLLLIKTTAAAWPRLAERVRALHPYELPELVLLEPAAVDPAYARWVRECVAAPAQGLEGRPGPR